MNKIIFILASVVVVFAAYLTIPSLRADIGLVSFKPLFQLTESELRLCPKEIYNATTERDFLLKRFVSIVDRVKAYHDVYDGKLKSAGKYILYLQDNPCVNKESQFCDSYTVVKKCFKAHLNLTKSLKKEINFCGDYEEIETVYEDFKVVSQDYLKRIQHFDGAYERVKSFTDKAQ